MYVCVCVCVCVCIYIYIFKTIWCTLLYYWFKIHKPPSVPRFGALFKPMKENTTILSVWHYQRRIISFFRKLRTPAPLINFWAILHYKKSFDKKNLHIPIDPSLKLMGYLLKRYHYWLMFLSESPDVLFQAFTVSANLAFVHFTFTTQSL